MAAAPVAADDFSVSAIPGSPSWCPCTCIATERRESYMEKEELWKLLDSLQGHIRAFDTKAQVALALDSLLAGLIGTEVAKSIELSCWQVNASTAWLTVLAALSVISLL